MRQEKKSNNYWKYFVYALIFILLIVICVQIAKTGSKGEQITAKEFNDLVQEGQVEEIYAQGGTVYVLKENSLISANNFPGKSDYYFTYSSGDELGLIIQDIKDYNDELCKDNPGKQINYTSEVQGESILSQILPYISIIVVLFIGFLIFRMFASGNKGTMNFGKSRIKTGENVKVKFSDVAGAVEEKEELKEVVEFLKSPQKFRELGARIPKGVLLVGPPGTGKTLLAKAVAGESNVPFFTISGSDFVEMFVGVGASRVRDLFDTAKKNMPCIIFIDEIDAVGRQRGTGMGGGNDEREQTLNQLLVEMDGFQANDGIIVMAATNRSDVLDPALMRPGRFDRQIYVGAPDVKARESIIRIYAKNKPLAPDINFTTLARITAGFTGADLENVMNEAAILAARAGRKKILMTDLTEGINKVYMGPQKKSNVVTERDRKITAYHEAGHALLAKLLANCDEVQEVSIISRGSAGGYTMNRPLNDDRYMFYNKIMDEIAMTMGGRIAEELTFGDITTGASADIMQATSLARKMVTEWGMSKNLGFIGIDTSTEPFLGRDYQTTHHNSEKMTAQVDENIREILESNYERAKKLLAKNISLLEELAKLLLLKNTIYSDEVNKLIAGEDAESVATFMEEREAKEQKIQEEAIKEAKDAQKNKEKELKLKTAEVLSKAGIISKDEYETLVKKHSDNSDNVENANQTELADNTLAEKPKRTRKPKVSSEPLSENKKIDDSDDANSNK